jgi:hypothetical protein
VIFNTRGQLIGMQQVSARSVGERVECSSATLGRCARANVRLSIELITLAMY